MGLKNTRQKGRKLVKIILGILRRELDGSSYEVVGSGMGKDKGDIRVPRLDLVIEVKNQQTIRMAEWVKQAEKEGLGYSEAVVMWRHPESPQERPDIRVDMSLDYFIELAQRFAEPITKEPSRELKYKLERLKNDCHQVIKLIK